MAWYRGGTVAVTNGSATVTGAGTDFVANVSVGHAFQGPDGRSYEVAAIVSATQLTLASAYQGATASGQAYSVQPTTSYAIDLAIQAAALVNAFGAIRDGIGQGLIASGTLAAPGLRFSADQDTGIRRVSENVGALVAGGVDRLRWASAGIDLPINPTTAAETVVAVRDTSAGAQGGASITGDMGGNRNHGVWMRMGYSDGLVGATDIVASTASRTWINGVERSRVASDGRMTITTGGGTVVAGPLDELPGQYRVVSVNGLTGNATAQGLVAGNGDDSLYVKTKPNGPVIFQRGTTENGRFDQNGNLLVGATSGSNHVFAKAVGAGVTTSEFRDNSGTFIFMNATGGGAAPAAASSAFAVRANASTGRSINAGGTINASGADYAEYIRKSDGCGTIAKGDVCGIDRNGLLVRLWSTAVRFVVKSTDPNLVGGDVWAAHLGERPTAPVYEVPIYDGPARPMKPTAPEPFVMPDITLPQQPTRDEGEDDEAFVLRMAAHLVEQSAALAAIAQAGEAEASSAAAQAEYAAAVRQYEIDRATYDAARDTYRAVELAAGGAHLKATTDYQAALAAWEAELETARQTVDRIAFCGQVPVNVDSDTLAACEAALADGVAVYLVAIARGAGIGVTAVRESDMTLPLYMRRVGCVWAIRDGRPWVDVQHG